MEYIDYNRWNAHIWSKYPNQMRKLSLSGDIIRVVDPDSNPEISYGYWSPIDGVGVIWEFA